MKVSELKNKTILILGFGREGKDTYAFLKENFPEATIGIADVKEDIQQKGATLHLGFSCLKAIAQYDVVIRSPGIPLKDIEKHLTNNQILTSQTEIFLSNTKGTVIGVTGTKGKSTTASLIFEVLKKGGLKAHLIGNIGTPVLSHLKDGAKKDIYVYELSSFQLATATISPSIAVFLNLFEEHLDWHGNMEAYAKAKANITIHQTEDDYLVFNKGDKEVEKIALLSKAHKLGFKPTMGKTGIAAPIEPVLLIAKIFEIPKETVLKAIKEFKPLDHRLQLVGTYNGIIFYNDSLATIPEATIAALDILGEDVQTLIAGGKDRGVSYEKLGKRISKSKIKTLILFKDTGKKILDALGNTNLECINVSNMKEAVTFAIKKTQKGKICLLSPASSSFNLFIDYEDRGKQFILYVKESSHS